MYIYEVTEVSNQYMSKDCAYTCNSHSFDTHFNSRYMVFELLIPFPLNRDRIYKGGKFVTRFLLYGGFLHTTLTLYGLRVSLSLAPCGFRPLKCSLQDFLLLRI